VSSASSLPVTSQPIAEQEGIQTVPEFFTEATAQQQREVMGAAAAILGRHVFAHVDNVHDFLRGGAALLARDGVLLIEVPYFGELVARLEFDTIYHEHLSYISIRPMARLCEERGLRLVDVEPVSLHGGSVLLHICRGDASRAPSEALNAMLRDEDNRGLAREEVLAEFSDRVLAWKGRFEQAIYDLTRDGVNLIGYGAAAKANTLLNFCPTAARSVRMILDKNPLKHGRYTPGTHIPVHPVERWVVDPATHMLILAWNFKDEIMSQMKPFADRGGRFVVPIPNPEVI